MASLLSERPGLEGLGPKALVDGQFFKDRCRRSDRIGTAEKRKMGFLGSGEQPPGNSLIAGHVPVKALLEFCGLHGIGVRYGLDVGGVVETVIQNLPVRLYELGMLLREFFLDIAVNIFKRTAVDEAGHSQSEHILAFEDGLQVHSAVLETLLRHGSDRSSNQSPVLDVKLGKRVVGQKTGFLHFCLSESIYVHKDHRRVLAPFCIRFQCCRIHRDEEVTVISRGVDILASDVDLKTGDPGNSTMGCSDFCRIVREGRQFVAIDGGHVGEKAACQLHSVTGISCEPDNDIFCVYNFMLHIDLKVLPHSVQKTQQRKQYKT